MEELLLQIPTTYTGWLTSITLTIVGIVYLFSRLRNKDVKILRDTNEDAFKRILQLESKEKDQNTEIDLLKDKVSTLEKQNKTLEDLVIVALKQYFFENPKMAEQLKEGVK